MTKLTRAVRDLAYVPKPPPISWMQAVGLKLVGTASVTWRSRSARTLFLVHQPGKVGSSSLTAALAQVAPPASVVFHTHRLSPAERRRELHERVWSRWAPRQMWGEAPAILAAVRKRPSATVVVTGIRNPIEREISAVLQNPDRYLDSNRSPRTDREVEVVLERLVAAVEWNLLARRLDRWFEVELDLVAGGPVPWEDLAGELRASGHAAVSSPSGPRTHILRFEDLDRGFAKLSVSEGLPIHALPHVNTSSSAKAVELVRSVGLSAAAVDASLSQRVVRAAYTTEEIEAWAAAWA